MASMCINTCIYLWPVNPDCSGAETHFRFRCYRTPINWSRPKRRACWAIIVPSATTLTWVAVLRTETARPANAAGTLYRLRSSTTRQVLAVHRIWQDLHAVL